MATGTQQETNGSRPFFPGLLSALGYLEVSQEVSQEAQEAREGAPLRSREMSTVSGLVRRRHPSS